MFTTRRRRSVSQLNTGTHLFLLYIDPNSNPSINCAWNTRVAVYEQI